MKNVQKTIEIFLRVRTVTKQTKTNRIYTPSLKFKSHELVILFQRCSLKYIWNFFSIINVKRTIYQIFENLLFPRTLFNKNQEYYSTIKYQIISYNTIRFEMHLFTAQ